MRDLPSTQPRRGFYLLFLALLCITAGGLAAQSSGDLGTLYKALKASRRQQIERLRVYTVRGRFPRNLDHPGRRIPYFVDRFGTRCAVGELMWRGGRQQEVAAIATANNHVRVLDVQGGPLTAWIARSGLTQEECARVQPSYEFYFTMAEKERKRIQAHLTKVEAQLRRDTEKSLGIALRRALDREIDVGELTRAHGEALMKMLVHREKNVRIGAAHAIGRLQLDARAALFARLRDPKEDGDVRFWVAATLLRTLPTPDQPAPYRTLLTALRERLEHGNEVSRMLAVGRIGILAQGARTLPGDRPVLREIRNTLQKHYKDPSKDVQHLARWMFAIARPTKPGLSILGDFNVGRRFLAFQSGYPVHAAALHLKPDELIAVLKKTPEAIRQKDAFGETPLHLAARSGWTQAAGLVKRGAKGDVRSRTGRLALHGATIRGIPGDVNAKDAVYGWTPLHYAAQDANGWLIQELLKRGADVNAKDRFGFTPLHVAVGCRTDEKEATTFGPTDSMGAYVVRELIEAGANRDAKDRAGRTVRDWGRKLGRKRCLVVLGKGG